MFTLISEMKLSEDFNAEETKNPTHLMTSVYQFLGKKQVEMSSCKKEKRSQSKQ